VVSKQSNPTHFRHISDTFGCKLLKSSMRPLGPPYTSQSARCLGTHPSCKSSESDLKKTQKRVFWVVFTLCLEIFGCFPEHEVWRHRTGTQRLTNRLRHFLYYDLGVKERRARIGWVGPAAHIRLWKKQPPKHQKVALRAMHGRGAHLTRRRGQANTQSRRGGDYVADGTRGGVSACEGCGVVEGGPCYSGHPCEEGFQGSRVTVTLRGHLGILNGGRVGAGREVTTL